MRFSVMAVLILAMMWGAGLHAADETKGKKKKKAMAEKTDGAEQAIVGMMAVKPPDAAKDVVGLIIGKNKKTYKVVATGEVAKSIEELRQKGTPLKITGVVTEDTIKASKAEEGPSRKK